jgi:hypothetical protein
VTRRLAALIAGVVIALGACAAPRNTLGTRSSACFRSLPTAKAAAHHEGHLVGVRRVDRGTLLKAFPKADPPPGHDFCVVGFSGQFHADKVDHPAGASEGRYAAVIVTMRGTTVVRTFLVEKLPLRLRH